MYVTAYLLRCLQNYWYLVLLALLVGDKYTNLMEKYKQLVPKCAKECAPRFHGLKKQYTAECVDQMTTWPEAADRVQLGVPKIGEHPTATTEKTKTKGRVPDTAEKALLCWNRGLKFRTGVKHGVRGCKMRKLCSYSSLLDVCEKYTGLFLHIFPKISDFIF